MDPVTGSLIAGGISAFGSALGGATNAQAQRDAARRQQQIAQQQLGQNYQQMGQSERQFGQTSNLNRANQLDQRAVTAADLQRRMNLAPLADQAAFFLRQRAGAPPTAFQPRDFTQGTMPGAGRATGGVEAGMNQAQQAMQGYQAGMGGMDTSVLAEAIKRMRDPSQLPGEYMAQTPDQMRADAEIQQRLVEAANARTAGDRTRLQNQINALQGTMGGGGQAPNVLRPNDIAQAQQDAERQAAQRRLMGMLGIPFGAIGAGIGGLIGNNRGR